MEPVAVDAAFAFAVAVRFFCKVKTRQNMLKLELTVDVVCNGHQVTNWLLIIA